MRIVNYFASDNIRKRADEILQCSKMLHTITLIFARSSSAVICAGTSPAIVGVLRHMETRSLYKAKSTHVL